MIVFEDDEIIVSDDQGNETRYGLGTPEAFKVLSKLWLRAGWDTKYVYSFTWLGRPIIQLPEDMFRLQEVLYRVVPDVIIETGVAHGGGLIFFASLCKAMGKGKVIGVELEFRPHNRKAVSEHELSEYITVIDGSSTDPDTVAQVEARIRPDEKVLVILDSNHTKAHVLAELEAYAPLVSMGSYLVACDGIMQDLVGAPRSEEDWATNNPCTAIREFVGKHAEFRNEEPEFPFNEGQIRQRVTYWPNAFLQRVAP